MTAPTSPKAVEHPQAVLASPARGPARAATAVAAATAVGGVVVAGISSGLLTGIPGLLLLVLALVLVPTGRSLSGRLAVNGAVLLGGVPLLWWPIWPLPVSHGAVLLGAVAFALTCWAVAASPSSRARRPLLPEVRPADALPVLAGAATCVATGRWLLAGRGEPALGQLLSGFDASSHVSMFVLMRSSGTTIPGVPETAGGPWAFSGYPTGYQAVASTLADVLLGQPGGPSEQVRAWNVSMVAVVALAMTVLVACLGAVACLRRRPGPAACGAALLCGAFVLGPGGVALADGFVPFWYAEALLAIGLIVAWTAPRPLSLAHLAALGAVVVGVAQSWAPLGLLLLPALVAAVLPWSTIGHRSVRWRTAAAGVVLLTAAGTVPVAVRLFSTVQVGTLVGATGGYSPPAPLPLLAVVVVACLAVRLVARSSPRVAAPAEVDLLASRARVLLWTPLVGVALAGALLASQLSRQGQPDYYFYKLVTAVELACVALLALGGAVLMATRRSPVPRMVLVALVALTTVAGVLLQPWSDSGLRALRSGDRNGTVDVTAPVQPRLVAGAILAAAAAPSGPGHEVVLAPFGSAALSEGALTQRWVLALDGGYTARAADVSLDLVSGSTDDAAILEGVRRVLTRHPEVVVVVPADRVDQVRDSLGSEELASRVRAY